MEYIIQVGENLRECAGEPMEWLVARVLLQQIPVALLIGEFNRTITALVGMKNARRFSCLILDLDVMG